MKNSNSNAKFKFKKRLINKSISQIERGIFKPLIIFGYWAFFPRLAFTAYNKKQNEYVVLYNPIETIVFYIVVGAVAITYALVLKGQGVSK